jgi:hypothetical protein
MREPIEVLEMQDRESWPVDEWFCSMGTDCCSTSWRPGFGAWIGHDSDGGTRTPWIVVTDDSFAWVVCEDCANIHQEKINERKNKWPQ